MSTTKTHREPRGWTLIELALVFVTVTLVIGLGAPRMAEVLSGAKVKAGENDLLAVVDAVDQYALRAGLASTQQSTAFSFDRDGHQPRNTAGFLVVDPWPILGSIVPDSFNGQNKFGQLYDAYVLVGADSTTMHVLSCVPVDEYKNYVAVNIRVSLDCSGPFCGNGFCDMTFVERLIAGRVTEDIGGETTILYTAAGTPPNGWTPGSTAPPPPPPGK